MIRIKRGAVARNFRKKYLRLTKGFSSLSSCLSTFAVEQVVQSFNFNYIGRKLKKRNFRKISLLITKNYLTNLKLNYSNFIGTLKKFNIFLNTKMLGLIGKKHSLLLMYLIKSHKIVCKC